MSAKLVNELQMTAEFDERSDETPQFIGIARVSNRSRQMLTLFHLRLKTTGFCDRINRDAIARGYIRHQFDRAANARRTEAQRANSG
jgi:hypothetical protein